MKIISDKNDIIFRKDFNDRPNYSIGLSKKDDKGNYVNGYMSVMFKKDTNLENKTIIKIKDAWISFYIKDKKTYPYIFVNDFEIIEKKEDEFENLSIKTEFDAGNQIKITDDDLPF